MIEKIPFERPLVIGTGGGNDIVSATMIVAELYRLGKKADLAGICSQGAWHRYDGKDEKPINRVTAGATRYRQSKQVQPMSFIDAKVPELLHKEGIHSKVYHLSYRYGTDALIADLEDFCKEQNYDGIVMVDVGGDILARGEKDPTILSPLMDFSTLYAVTQARIPSGLVEFGLQTDGELRSEGCREILEELKQTGALLDVQQIGFDDSSVKVFQRIYDGVKEIRHGHTAVMTLETLRAKEERPKEDIHTEYRARIQVLDKKWFHTFPITLEAEYFGKIFTIDPHKMVGTRPHAFAYKTVLESCIRSKKIVDTKAEMDMLYTLVDDVCVWLGLVCPQIEGSRRAEIINYGLHGYAFQGLSAHADAAILWKKDAEKITLPPICQTVDDFVVVGDNMHDVSQVARELEKIIEK